METIYKTNEQGNFIKLDKYESNNWIHLTNPSDEEITKISETFRIKKRTLMKLLDNAELPRVESLNNNLLIVIDLPYTVKYHNVNKYRVMPLGIILMPNGIITVSSKEHSLIDDIKSNQIKGLNISDKQSFPLYLIGKSVEYYLKFLNEIQKDIRAKESILAKATNNRELVHMLTLEKSLVYFINSLRGNDLVIEKLENINHELFKEKDIELLKDVKIETKQGIEMANIYREILDSTMDTYGTIISNNLNDVMKFLTSITLVISIPTMIASFMGMNVPLGDFAINPASFLVLVLISLVLSIIIIIILHRKNLL